MTRNDTMVRVSLREAHVDSGAFSSTISLPPRVGSQACLPFVVGR